MFPLFPTSIKLALAAVELQKDTIYLKALGIAEPVDWLLFEPNQRKAFIRAACEGLPYEECLQSARVEPHIRLPMQLAKSAVGIYN